MSGKVTVIKVFGLVFLAFGLFILSVSFYIGPSLNTITGGLLSIMGILYLVNPIVTYDSNGFKIKNLFGMTLKPYTFSNDKMEIRDGKIYINDKKAKIAKSMLVKKEYQDMLEHISNGLE